jgi:hypothetical protein
LAFVAGLFLGDADPAHRRLAHVLGVSLIFAIAYLRPMNKLDRREILKAIGRSSSVSCRDSSSLVRSHAHAGVYYNDLSH